MDHSTDGSQFVRLATLGDPNSAQLCAALLDSAGIVARVHGESMGPYPMTVGQMAVTEIWVRDHDVDEAKELMLAAEIDQVLGFEGRSGALVDREGLPVRVMAFVLVIVLGAAVVRFLMRVF